MKKIFSILFALVLIVMVSSCSNDNVKEIAGCSAPTSKTLATKLIYKDFINTFENLRIVAQKPKSIRLLNDLLSYFKESGPSMIQLRDIATTKENAKIGNFECIAYVYVKRANDHKLVKSGWVKYNTQITDNHKKVIVTITDNKHLLNFLNN